MNPWQSATTEVEPGHRGLQAVAAVDPDRVVRQLVEAVPAAASPLEAHAAPARRVVASQADHQIVLVRRHPDQAHQIVGMIGATIIRVPAPLVLPAVVIAVGWILAQTVIVLVVLLLVRVQVAMIVVAMIVRVVLLLVPVTPIVVKAVVAMIVAGMTVNVPVLLVRVEVAMIVRVVLRRAPVTPIVAMTGAGMIVVAMSVRAQAIRIVPIPVVAMIVPVHPLLDPTTGMIVVAIRVQAAIDRAVRLLVAGRRIVAMTVHAVLLPGPLIVAMIGAGMIAHVPRLRVQAALGRIGIVMSVHALPHLVQDIRIVVMNVVMTVPHVRQIVRLPDAHVTLAKNETIVVRALPCAVATMAIRFVIRVSQMTSRPRILIAAC